MATSRRCRSSRWPLCHLDRGIGGAQGKDLGKFTASLKKGKKGWFGELEVEGGQSQDLSSSIYTYFNEMKIIHFGEY